VTQLSMIPAIFGGFVRWRESMSRVGFMIIALALAVTPLAARAGVVSGTWSFSASQFPITSGVSGGLSGSATFSFDNAVSTCGAIADFTSNFGATSASYCLHPIGSLDIYLYSGVNDYFSADFFPYTTFNGDIYSVSGNGFIPLIQAGFFTSAPEPSSFALFSLAAIGVMAARRRRVVWHTA
jgi:hypothetical protein